MSNRSSGAWGEEVALRYLLERGYELLERNYRTRYGAEDQQSDAAVLGSVLHCPLLVAAGGEHHSLLCAHIQELRAQGHNQVALHSGAVALALDKHRELGASELGEPCDDVELVLATGAIDLLQVA